MEKDALHEFTREQRQMLALCLACGILFVYMFYGRSPGVSVPLFAGAVYGVFYRTNMGDANWRNPDFGLLLLAPIALLSFTYVLFYNEVFRVLNVLAIPILMAVQMTWSAHKERFRWYDPKFPAHVFRQLVPRTLASVPVPIKMAGTMLRHGRSLGRWRYLAKVGFGLLLSLPPLLIVVMLLSSADSVFADAVNGIPDLAARLNAWEWFGRVVVAAIAAMAIFAFWWGLLHPRAGGERESSPQQSAALFPTEAERPLRLDPTIAITFLAMLNFVYVCFAVIQFSYFFAAGGGDLPSGTSYAEYARRGFAELVVVTVINLSIVLGVLTFLNREARVAVRLVQSLLTLLIAATGVMLVSAFLRLSLYEEAYGYTYTRLLVHAFMIFLAALFAVALYKIWRERANLLKPYIVITIGAYVIVNYLNIDVMIAHNNIDRYERTGKIDVDYLGGLSHDAVPALVRLNGKTDKPDGLGEMLADRKARLAAERTAWMSWNWAETRARRLLRQIGS